MLHHTNRNIIFFLYIFVSTEIMVYCWTFFPRLRDTAIKSPILIFTTADKEKYISRDKIFYIFKEKLCIYEVNISECQNHLAFGNIHI